MKKLCRVEFSDVLIDDLQLSVGMEATWFVVFADFPVNTLTIGHFKLSPWISEHRIERDVHSWTHELV